MPGSLSATHEGTMHALTIWSIPEDWEVRVKQKKTFVHLSIPLSFMPLYPGLDGSESRVNSRKTLRELGIHPESQDTMQTH